jgi:tetratricopeptide (TPR) repeat protein
MSDHDGSKPPAGWLNHLREAGHWSRLIEMAARSLAVDPNDPETHRHIAWAYAHCNRFSEMWPHVDFLLKAEPDEPLNHHLAAIYYLDTNQHRKARAHIDLLLGYSPNSATYHYLACIHALRCNNTSSARFHIGRARALSPNWAAAAHLEIKMDGARQKKARQAWDRVRRLKETLALDPRNSDVMFTIGDILLTELERPREAESFFRDALLIDPTDKNNQGKLLDSIRARSLLYRTLSLPSSALRNIKTAYQRGRLNWVLIVLAAKIFLLALVWWIVIGFFFTPAAKIYEWLVLADISRTKTRSRILAPLHQTLAWPLWLRMSAAVTLIVGAWFLILWAFLKQPLLALQIMAFTFGFHLALVGFVVGLRRLRARFGFWQEARRLRRERSASQPGEKRNGSARSVSGVV